MGARVTHANHLGALLTQPAPRGATPIPAYQHLIERIAQWRSDIFKGGILKQTLGQAPKPKQLNEFQEGIVAAQRRLIALGLPEGQP